jgi:hypothetical protein
MKSRLRKALLWSSVGSMLLGGAVAAVARRARRKPPVQLEGCRIPPDCRRTLVWTEPFDLGSEPQQMTRARDLYVLESTPFIVWSVLELSVQPDQEESNRGTPIYHVTRMRVTEKASRGGLMGEERERLDRFYATVGMPSHRPSLGKNVLARGATLELVLCNVGGSTNGVETDQVHQSVRPVLNFRFEYTEQHKESDRIPDDSPPCIAGT